MNHGHWVPLFAIFVAAMACSKTRTDKGGDSKGAVGGKEGKDGKDDGGPLEFKCNTSIALLSDELKPKAVDVFSVQCPRGCTLGALYGTGTYSYDSSVCVAAVHAGAAKTEARGVVKVKMAKGLDAYRGSKRHGIQSHDSGGAAKSFFFTGFESKVDENSMFSCSKSPRDLKKEPGDKFTVTCPEGCGEGVLYGTDVYTTDSSICLAALHAGVIEASKGGPVTVKVSKGSPSYKGSTARGVSSRDWLAYDGSFTVE
jgi:hypothetical protein